MLHSSDQTRSTLRQPAGARVVGDVLDLTDCRLALSRDPPLRWRRAGVPGSRNAPLTWEDTGYDASIGTTKKGTSEVKAWRGLVPVFDEPDLATLAGDSYRTRARRELLAKDRDN
jgi:hypothetical protein